MIPFFNLKALNDRDTDELELALKRVLASGWYILGKEVNAFESEMREYVGVKEVIGVGNGLDALTLIIRGYKELGLLKDGDEIIVAANAYIATVLAITENNLVPVFVDPDPYTHNLDIEKIESSITSRTKAVMLLHLYGLINFDEKIESLKGKYNLIIIEDGAQAAGAEWRGKKVGVLGDACGMSLYPTKNLGALGDAGLIMTNNMELAHVVRALGNYGSSERYVNVYKGTNSRLDEIQAAVLRVKLKRLDSDNAIRRSYAERYVRGITNPLIEMSSIEYGLSHVWHLFVIKVKNRERFIEHMTQEGIGTLIHYPIPPYRQKAYSEFNTLTYPVTEELVRSVVSIPLHPALSEEDIEHIISCCNTYAG